MKKAAFAVILPFVLGGCFQVREARLEYQESTARYKACLSANPAAPQNCESLRLVMEADERKYTAIGSAMEGNSASINVNNRNR